MSNNTPTNIPARKTSFVLIFALVMLSACFRSSPEAVARKFLKAVEENNWELAASLGTEATQKVLDLVKELTGGQARENGPYQLLSCTESAITAECLYLDQRKNIQQTLHLKKSDKDWKVDLKK